MCSTTSWRTTGPVPSWPTPASPAGSTPTVTTADDSVTVTIQKDVDMWLLTGVTSTLDVDGSACVAIGITGAEPTAQC